MKVEIEIDDFLTAEDKKELCKEYVREALRGAPHHEERVLSNMAYSAAYAILDSVLTPEMLFSIREKAKAVILSPGEFGIFRKKDAWGTEDSPAYLEVQKAVEEHKHLINPLVKRAILDHDYTKDLPGSSEWIGEVLIDALRKGLEAQA